MNTTFTAGRESAIVVDCAVVLGGSVRATVVGVAVVVEVGVDALEVVGPVVSAAVDDATTVVLMSVGPPVVAVEVDDVSDVDTCTEVLPASGWVVVV